MKMLLTACTAILFFIACTKMDTVPASETLSAASIDDLSIVKTRSALLLSHPWIYKGFYFHYVDQQHKGDPQYVRGASNNIINLDDTKYIFKRNGTFVEYDGGYTYPGTWTFTDNTASLLVLDYTYWTNKDSILVLNSGLCSYTGSLGYHDRSYTELIPAQ